MRSSARTSTVPRGAAPGSRSADRPGLAREQQLGQVALALLRDGVVDLAVTSWSWVGREVRRKTPTGTGKSG